MKPKDNMEITRFRNRLKEIRKEMLLSQSELAKNLKIPTSTYANWEQGRTEPNIQELFKLIKFFEIDANDLFDLDDF